MASAAATLRNALSSAIGRRALGAGAIGALGAGGVLGMNALSGGASRGDEPEADYYERTGNQALNPLEWEQMRQEVVDRIRGARVYAVMSDIDPEKAEIVRTYQPAFQRITEAGSLVKAGDVRAAIEGIAAVDPEAGASLNARLNRLISPRDRDINEAPGNILGGVGGVLAGLALTRGKSPRARSAALKALTVGGLGAAGAAGGGVAQNAMQSVLTERDVGEQLGPAGLALALGTGASGARSGLRRLARDAAVRSARVEMARPPIDESLPYWDRLAAEETALAQARRASLSPLTDAQIAAPLLLHMERTLAAAGRPRMLTTADTEGQIASLIKRQGGRRGTDKAVGDLNQAYRGLLADLDLGAGEVPDLRLLEPDVVNPRVLAELEAAVGQIMSSRTKAEARIKRLPLEGVVADLRALEGRRGLDPTERYAKRLLEQRFVQLKGKEATASASESKRAATLAKRAVAARNAPTTGDELLGKARQAQGKALSDEAISREREQMQARINRLGSERAVQDAMTKIQARLGAGNVPQPEREMLQSIMADLRARMRILAGRTRRTALAKRVGVKKPRQTPARIRNALINLPRPERPS